MDSACRRRAGRLRRDKQGSAYESAGASRARATGRALLPRGLLRLPNSRPQPRLAHFEFLDAEFERRDVRTLDATFDEQVRQGLLVLSQLTFERGDATGG